MEKIKVGLLIDAFEIPAWAFKMVESIVDSDYAMLTLIVKKEPTTAKLSMTTRLWSKVRYGFVSLYQRWENRKQSTTPNAFQNKDLRSLLQEVPVLPVRVIEKKYSDYFTESDLEKIKGYEVDVFIRLGFRILKGEILSLAKLGVWSYHHGDNLTHRGGPAGFWEYFYGKNEVGSILQILTDELDGGQVLYRSWSGVYHSLNETRNGYYWKTAGFVPRKLKEAQTLGADAFLAKVREENSQLQFYSEKLYTVPENRSFSSLLASLFWQRLKSKVWNMFFYEQWILFYRFRKNNTPAPAIFQYKRLVPPKDRFWADPLVICDNDRYFIFFEELFYKENKGRIAVIEISKEGVCSPAKVVLDRPYHLSYPFVFFYEGCYYMIPETHKNSTIELYKATEFPFQWEFVMNLMENVVAVDTTVFFKDNKVWLFTNLVEMEGAPYHDELFLFSADCLFTKEWKSHPCNPIVSDVKSARSAGALFFYNGKLYRPSQDCSYRYGYSIVVNEVVALNEKEYKETKVSTVLPNWEPGVFGTHTLSFSQDLTVIDALIKRKK